MRKTVEMLHMLATAVLMLLTAEILQIARTILIARMEGK